MKKGKMILFRVTAPILLVMAFPSSGHAEADTISLSMTDVIRMAQESSPQARQAKVSFESAWYNYRSYKAEYLPSLSLSSNPSLNRSTSSVTLPD